MKKSAAFLSFIIIMSALVGFLYPRSMNARGTDISGLIDMDTTWDLAGSPYIIVGDVTVISGVTLAIEAGVIIVFDGNYNIDVYGNLLSNGTETNNIKIHGDVFAAPGGRILVGGYAEINYTQIYDTFYGLELYSANSIVSNSMIGNNILQELLVVSSNNVITNNEIFGLGLMGPSNEIGIYISSSNNTISNNTISGNEGGNILIAGGSNLIENNTIEFGYRYGINIIASGNVIRNNSIIDSECGGINISSSSNNDITGNSIINTQWGGHGIDIISSSFNTITNNKILSNMNRGINLYSSMNNTIANNNISDNYGGIFLESSSNNNIINNDIKSNQIENAISFYSSSNNMVIDNNISNNWPDGIYMEGTSLNNIFVNNDVLNNGYGIMNGYGFNIKSSRNRIYHNNIINNYYQAYDNGNDNLWNETYPFGGNYWSDYSPLCQDLYDGPITPQITGSPDGICDFQYNIDADSNDFYPLRNLIKFKLPAPPTNISAALTGDNQENVTISWDASQDDPVNITNYAIYYSANYSIKASNYKFLTEVTATGALQYNLTIQGLGNGDPYNYFFCVQVNTTLIYSFSRSNMQAAKYTKNMTTGMHLMSIPLIPNDTNISRILELLNYDIAWYYDNTDFLDSWKLYNRLKPINDLKLIDHTMALWINITSDGSITTGGTVPQATNILLKAGWNFIGYPSFAEKAVSEVLNNIIYERIEGYDTNPPEYLRIYNESDIMKPGFGYWIKVPSDQILTVTNT